MPLLWAIGGGIISGVLGGASQSAQNNQARDAARRQTSITTKYMSFNTVASMMVR